MIIGLIRSKNNVKAAAPAGPVIMTLQFFFFLNASFIEFIIKAIDSLVKNFLTKWKKKKKN